MNTTAKSISIQSRAALALLGLGLALTQGLTPSPAQASTVPKLNLSDTPIARDTRPALSFAPVIKKEAYGEWFETLGMAESPFMLYTHKALRPDETAAVTHVDGTSRVQTVSAEQNPYLYRVLDAFERRTGVPVLINTSFNLRGEPIVSSPSDALKTFFASGIDALAIENFLVEKPDAD